MDEAARPEDSYFLRVGGSEPDGSMGKLEYAPVFHVGDTEVRVVGQLLAGSGVFVFVGIEPLPVCCDGRVEPQEDGVHAGGQARFESCEDEGGSCEDGVEKSEGGFAVGESLGEGVAGGLGREGGC